jgi:hypothetical protein
MSEPEEILAIEDSLVYIRGNYNKLYPKTENRRNIIGNLPNRLHEDIKAFAEARNLRMFEVIAGLWDFLEVYEETYKDELKEQRTTNKNKR